MHLFSAELEWRRADVRPRLNLNTLLLTLPQPLINPPPPQPHLMLAVGAAEAARDEWTIFPTTTIRQFLPGGYSTEI